jgi:hypothetical protein
MRGDMKKLMTYLSVLLILLGASSIALYLAFQGSETLARVVLAVFILRFLIGLIVHGIDIAERKLG